MINYCSTCDEMCDFSEEVTHFVNEVEQVWYVCGKCKSGYSYKPANPPEVRDFDYLCGECGMVPFQWEEECQGAKAGWNHWYKCSKCDVRYNLPNTPEERKTYMEWQAAGCPPPWWFRPTQALVLLTVIVLSYLFPMVMLTLYLASCYLLAAYLLWTGEIVHNDKMSGFCFFTFAPVLIPIIILFFAIRLPVL